MASKTLLIVVHAPSPNTKKLAQAAYNGANHPDLDINVILKSPQDTQPEDVLAADALLLGTTENLAYMAGITKDFFDRCYYPVLEEKQGMPFALYIRAGHDGTGTKLAMKTITTGLRWEWIVSVGHGAVVHGCTVEDDCLIGMSATIMNGAVIGAGSLVAGGAVVLEGAIIPPGSLVAGVPAKVRRALSAEELEHVRENAAHYVTLARKHKAVQA